MKISVIVPLYYGEKYLDNLIQKFKENQKSLPESIKLQIIFVKDSMEDIDLCKYEDSSIDINFIQNKTNRGIHFSRVEGIKYATGEFIHMLDQDDEITGDFYCNFLNKMKNADVIVGNGIEQRTNYDKMLYKFYFMHYTVKFSYFYTRFSCRIISPGQCLIRKKSIPQEWFENIVTNNGADDAMLWLMMLYEKKLFVLNRHVGYIHVNTGNNVSLDTKIMKKSVEEVRDILSKTGMVSKGDLKRLNLKLCNRNESFIVRIIEVVNKKKR